MVDAVKEVELAERLGVSREVVRKIRMDLQEGEHWRQEHRFVELTPAGVTAVKAALSEPREAPPELSKVESPVDGVVELTVKRIYPRNPRVLEATYDGATVIVRVRRNVNFTAGMVIPCRPQSAGVWALARACPRFRGRW
jgi:hypothetical protein